MRKAEQFQKQLYRAEEDRRQALATSEALTSLWQKKFDKAQNENYDLRWVGVLLVMNIVRVCDDYGQVGLGLSTVELLLHMYMCLIITFLQWHDYMYIKFICTLWYDIKSHILFLRQMFGGLG